MVRTDVYGDATMFQSTALPESWWLNPGRGSASLCSAYSGCPANSTHIANATDWVGRSELVCCDCPLCADARALLAFRAGGDPDGDLASWDPLTSPCGAGWNSRTA